MGKGSVGLEMDADAVHTARRGGGKDVQERTPVNEQVSHLVLVAIGSNQNCAE